MADYRKTQSFYDLEKYPYSPNPSQIDLDNWEREVSVRRNIPPRPKPSRDPLPA